MLPEKGSEIAGARTYVGGMKDAPIPPQPTGSAFGQALRGWRKMRRLSQMHLAHLAGTTPRHLSFLETGRSRPGRDLVLRLGSALDLSLRDQNALLRAAGLPAAFADRSDTDLSNHPLAPALQRIIDRHAPYPAAVFNRLGRTLMANAPFLTLAPNLLDYTPEESIDQFFGAGGGPAMFANWDAMAWAWVTRMQSKLAEAPDPEMAALLERGLRHLGGHPARPPAGSDDPDVISPIWRFGDQLIHTYTTVMRFDGVQEVALSELHIEMIFPLDAAAEAFFAHLSLPGN